MIVLKRYVCHKRVNAGKILDVTLRREGGAVLTLETQAGADTLGVSEAYVNKHLAGVEFSAIVGGYYVQYDDGYESYSPGPVFEDGYSAERLGV